MNIVLVEPEIPQNTGNIARLAVATNSRLYLVGKLGFSLEDKMVRRAGLDYWKHLTLITLDRLEELTNKIPDDKLFFFSKRAKKNYLSANYPRESFLIFGKESWGLDVKITEKYSKRLFKIPMTEKVRSLNLANAVSIVVYEGLRQQTHL
jgi:tRNA (cytidine/uridine-2'-O-)-methyltransferase